MKTLLKILCILLPFKPYDLYSCLRNVTRNLDLLRSRYFYSDIRVACLKCNFVILEIPVDILRSIYLLLQHLAGQFTQLKWMSLFMNSRTLRRSPTTIHFLNNYKTDNIHINQLYSFLWSKLNLQQAQYI